MSEKEIEEFLAYFGEKVPDPIHQPLQFKHLVKLWKFYQSRK